jgi:hypothetical protein
VACWQYLTCGLAVIPMLWVETTAVYCTVDWLPIVGFLPRL